MPKQLDEYFKTAMGELTVQNTLLRAQAEALAEQLEAVTKERDELKGKSEKGKGKVKDAPAE